MTTREFIDSIKKADLSKVSYNKIVSDIKFNSIKLPYTTTLIKKGQFIERGRINNNQEIFNSEFEISYRTDTGNITKFGRANKPFQSRFYGAMPSNNLKLARIVLFSELVEQFRDTTTTEHETTMTIGRWFVKEDFEVADVCYSSRYFGVSDLKDKYNYWVNKTKNTEIGKKEFQELLEFFSNEFSKPHIENHSDYKLSSIYTDLAILANGLKGIIYPSVRTDYLANNIALPAETVEQYLELKEVAVFEFSNKNSNPIILPKSYSDELGAYNSKFNWKNYN
ncbi:hypothetical protein LNJ05_12485 [Tenacibaculum finnmarkense genomovar ulcerans]|uniref:hypothetical protein n=1 Tax=Tenacibaculum TaxID=104267 RepID=UPI001E558FFB|nr:MULTISPECIES: hypothetical protein [Tenacibaculum]MCD8433580.1 hypothetical protein [Tenacibaculum finnmarkense genomovar ulcerans]